VQFCKTQGIKAFGIDIEREQIEWARNKWGLDVCQASVENFQPGYSFSAVVMADVLEHVWDPVAALINIRSILEPKGFLVVQVPNLLGIKVPPGHSWGVPHHLWQFNQKTLTRIIVENGFEVISSSTGVLGIIGMYEKGFLSFKEQLYIWLAKKFHIGNRLMLICKKNDYK
ncbi:MAG: class I SAM-dependent methyltransferase, partial [Desulfobacterales bacterium]|nr:class I SAM-dependent methyltransferase [Desulfobacterales bacterium]